MNWYDKIKEIHSKADNLRSEATKIAAKLGHKLDAWTTSQTAKCRKCGQTAKINGVYCEDGNAVFEGAPFINKCSVKFDGEDNYSWKEFTNPWPKDSMT